MADSFSVVLNINDISKFKADVGNTMDPKADPLIAKRNILKCLMGSNRIRSLYVSILPEATEQSYVSKGYALRLEAFRYAIETHHFAMTQAIKIRRNHDETPHQPDSVRGVCELVQQHIDNFPTDIEDPDKMRDMLYALKQEHMDNLKHMEDQYELIEEFAISNFDEAAPIHNILLHCIETINIINNTIYNFYTFMFNTYDKLAAM
jgi:hypothetical protein